MQSLKLKERYAEKTKSIEIELHRRASLRTQKQIMKYKIVNNTGYPEARRRAIQRNSNRILFKSHHKIHAQEKDRYTC